MYIVFSEEQAAAALWTYGEDRLISRALGLTEPDLRDLWAKAGRRWALEHGLPLEGKLTSDKAIAFACIEFFEGALRPLSRSRRRPMRSMPDRLRDARPVAPETVVHDEAEEP